MTTREPLGTEHDELLFAVRRSVRYHRHRERFLDRAHQPGGGPSRILRGRYGRGAAGRPSGWVDLGASRHRVSDGPRRHRRTGLRACARRPVSRFLGRFLGLEKDLLRAGLSLTRKRSPSFRVVGSTSRPANRLSTECSMRSVPTSWRRRSGSIRPSGAT